MTITLTSQTETRLRERASRMGQEISTLADTLLADALSYSDPDDLTPEEIAEIRAGIRRGLVAASEGRERPAAEYAADVLRRRAERQSGPVLHV